MKIKGENFFMNKIKKIISQISSLFTITNLNVLEKYPATYEKDIKKSLEVCWNNVESAIKKISR